MHGGNIYSFAEKHGIAPESVIDFSANMNDFISIKGMKIKSTYIKNYPESDLEAYKSILSGRKFKPANIAIIPGLTSFIHSFMQGIDGISIIISPAFTEYLDASSENSRVILPMDTVESAPEIIKNYNFKAVFLVYPDNPTGQLISEKSLVKILDICVYKSAMLFLDESFIWFVNKREIDEGELIEKYPNLIIGRSLTKILAIPGLRLAYLISSAGHINEIEKRLDPWRINQPALLYLLKSNMDFCQIAEKTEIERKYVIKSLEKAGLALVGHPRANFATFRLPDSVNGERIKEFLAGNNIMIRVLDDYPEFGINYIRIGIKQHKKNIILIKSIEKYIGGFHD